MGATADVIYIGESDGVYGKWAPFPAPYDLPYMDGYRYGFCVRKAKGTGRTAAELEDLMTSPRITSRREDLPA